MFGFFKKKNTEEKKEEVRIKKCKMCGRKLEPGTDSELCKRCKLGIR